MKLVSGRTRFTHFLAEKRLVTIWDRRSQDYPKMRSGPDSGMVLHCNLIEYIH